jgi:uncharacterized membrane protein YoaK (UPF0700 family)
MLKQLLGAFAGFVLWSVGWLSFKLALKKLALLPSDQTQRVQDVKALFALLVGSFALSLVAGRGTAVIGRTASSLPILLLGLLLLAVGIVFQTQFWRLMPLWYHLSFLALLIPFCYLGAWLRTVTRG